uniref:Uncharacterized protein n=1 Tax=Acrobeloides nanus TaxID=290746 RepID=A0A914CSB4_9BILA
MAITIRELFGDVMPGQGPIMCPSGNQVYVHPISGDLQQCSQQLGFYNQTTCPGGTVCERFPILVPGFQDYCCWGNDTTDNEVAILGTTTELPEEMLQSTTDITYSSTDYTTTSRPDESDEVITTTSNVIGSIISGGRKGSGGRRGKEKKKNISEESDEWITMTTRAPRTRKTRRPRLNKKKTTVSTDPTTTTTTTMR